MLTAETNYLYITVEIILNRKKSLITWASHRNVKKKILISLVGIAIWLTAQSIHK
jgi:hypothetical protein